MAIYIAALLHFYGRKAKAARAQEQEMSRRAELIKKLLKLQEKSKRRRRDKGAADD